MEQGQPKHTEETSAFEDYDELQKGIDEIMEKNPEIFKRLEKL